MKNLLFTTQVLISVTSFLVTKKFLLDNRIL